jgi:hypothetical protein
MKLKIVDNSTEYYVDETNLNLAAIAEKYKIYVCGISDRENAALLQISASAEFNTALERAATTLQLLKAESDELGEEYSKFHFDWLFPDLTASFLYKDGRRINVLSIKEVSNVKELHALSQIIKYKRQDAVTYIEHRVDIRTAIWIFGRMLKLLMFIHPRGYSISPTPSKMLVHPGVKDEVRHQAVLFNWNSVTIHKDFVPVPFRQRDIKAAAKTTLKLLGVREGQDYSRLEESGFIKYVFGLIENDGDILEIYRSYYRYIYDVFGEGFHEFTTIKI